MSTARRKKRLRVTFSVYFLVLLSCMLALDGTGLVALAFFCVLAHEAGHLAALAAFHVPVEGFSFRIFGAEIRAPRRAQLAYAKEAAVDLAGPAANFVLCLAALALWRCGWWTKAAEAVLAVSLLLGLFNLLPVGGLDGGRALESALLCRFSPETVRRVCVAVSLLTILPVGCFGVWLFVHARNVTLLLAVVYLMAAMLQTGTRSRVMPKGKRFSRRPAGG